MDNEPKIDPEIEVKPIIGSNCCENTSDKMLDFVLEKTLTPEISDDGVLSGRELEILKLIISGKTNKEIAGELCRNQRTVEYHRNNIMKKLDAHTAADLVRKAISLGLL